MDQSRVTELAARDAGIALARRVAWYPDDHPGWQRLEEAMQELTGVTE